MSTIKQYCALFLAVLLLLVPITYLFCMVSNIDKKIDEQFLESEKTTSEIVMVTLIGCQCTPTEETEPTEEEQPSEQQTEPEQLDSTKPADTPTNYYGRLCIPDAGIDVALYYGAQQEICDRQDSANIFATSIFNGLYIADHNNQEFGKLFNVKVGMRGYLRLANDVVLNIVCTDVLNGHNTGKYIVDENGNTNLDADYLMYTCRDGRQNILICLWKHC